MSLVAVVATLNFSACMPTAPPSTPENLPTFQTGQQNKNAPLPEEIVQQNQKAEGQAEIYLAGGCFWGTEFLMLNVPGVENVEVGYSNGLTRNPTYREVCNDSGHAESAHIIYSPDVVSLEKLLEVYCMSIDPTLLNQQGKDKGIQYRTGIYYSDPADEATIKKSLDKLQNSLTNRVVIECLPIKNFYRAEEEHQQYLLKNPNGYCHVSRTFINEQAKTKAAELFPNKDFSRNAIYDKPTKEVLNTLSELQRAVTQNAETEPPFKNEYEEESRSGIYVDVTNGQPLFVSTDKFNSGCGWPAFSKPIDKAALVERKELSYGTERVAVRAKASNAHLGHLLDNDAKNKGGYSINSAALRFVPREKMQEEGYGEWLDLFKD